MPLEKPLETPDRSVLGCFDFSFSVRPDKRVDVLLAAATEHKQLAFR